jgi:hypothetical protein
MPLPCLPVSASSSSSDAGVAREIRDGGRRQPGDYRTLFGGRMPAGLVPGSAHGLSRAPRRSGQPLGLRPAKRARKTRST